MIGLINVIKEKSNIAGPMHPADRMALVGDVFEKIITYHTCQKQCK